MGSQARDPHSYQQHKLPPQVPKKEMEQVVDDNLSISAYDLGWKSSISLYSRDDNPYPKNSTEAVDWYTGYDEASVIGSRTKKADYERVLFDHYIICDYSKNASIIAAQFIRQKTRFVIIETDDKLFKSAESNNVPVINADCFDGADLYKAGGDLAHGLVLTFENDDIAARLALKRRLNSDDIFIVAHAIHKKNAAKLLLAGVDRVILPSIAEKDRARCSLLGTGIKSAEIINRTGHDERGRSFRSFDLSERPDLVGHSIAELSLENRFTTFVCILRDHIVLWNTNPDETLQDDDVLVVSGSGLSPYILKAPPNLDV